MNELIIGLEGLALGTADIARLLNQHVGGVILFARNYASPDQLSALCSSIKKVRSDLIITVDQEGGRVQRFRSGFTVLPDLQTFGELYDQNPDAAFMAAKKSAMLMSHELKLCGVDLSFAPVVDLGINDSVIGNRAFHRDPEIVIHLAQAYIEGMHENGMRAVLKHFPGHGSVQGDTHHSCVIDSRSFKEIQETDLKPFTELVSKVDAVMVSHVVYPEVDDKPASVSQYWVKKILRNQLGFAGTVFSDDMGMQAAQISTSPAECVWRALDAGCTAVLLCNEFDVIDAVLKEFNTKTN